MNSYALIVKPDTVSQDLKIKLKKELDVFMKEDKDHPEIVISIGGDGTLLYAVHQYIDQLDSTAFVGIHTGTLGFYTDYLKEEYLDLVNDIKTKEPVIFHRNLLDIKSPKKHYYALNEMRIENNRRSQVLDVYINDEHMETFRGNGVLISTPSGSTAYSKSLQGAVIDPESKLMQLTEIAGIHHNAYRTLGAPLILSGDKTIALETQTFKDSILGVDLDVIDITYNVRLEISIADKSARFLDYRNVSFLERLKKSFL